MQRAATRSGGVTIRGGDGARRRSRRRAAGAPDGASPCRVARSPDLAATAPRTSRSSKLRPTAGCASGTRQAGASPSSSAGLRCYDPGGRRRAPRARSGIRRRVAPSARPTPPSRMSAAYVCSVTRSQGRPPRWGEPVHALREVTPPLAPRNGGSPCLDFPCGSTQPPIRPHSQVSPGSPRSAPQVSGGPRGGIAGSRSDLTRNRPVATASSYLRACSRYVSDFVALLLFGGQPPPPRTPVAWRPPAAMYTLSLIWGLP